MIELFWLCEPVIGLIMHRRFIYDREYFEAAKDY